MDFILQRAKAAVAILAVGIIPLLLNALESTLGIAVPNEWKIGITSVLTGLIVHQTPNKPT
jgi:hypothetical protein